MRLFGDVRVVTCFPGFTVSSGVKCGAQNPDEACKMARVAFEDVIVEPDNVAEDSWQRLHSHHDVWCGG